MGAKKRARIRPGRIADGALAVAIVSAPLLGGGTDLRLLPLWCLLSWVAFVTSAPGRTANFRIAAFLTPVALIALAVFTALQALLLPPGVLELISPRAYELRSFVGDANAWMPLSYEPSATLRDAARLLSYALITSAAYRRVQSGRGFAVIAVPVVVAGLASVTVAFIHEVVGATQILGIFRWKLTNLTLWTSFVNPNHGSAFMVIGALTALGMASGSQEGQRKAGLLAAAALMALVNVLCYSRGGLAAMCVAVVVFFVLLLKGPASDQIESRPYWLLGVLVVPLIALFADPASLQFAFATSDADPLGMQGKLEAIQDAGPLVRDHAWFGIGRGSYVSVYSAYKTAPVQLTFTHPENLVVQLVSDWGIGIGATAIVGLFYCVIRRVLKAETPVVLGASAAVLAVCLQNVVDFSLEVPGVAFSIAAIVGGAGARVVKRRSTIPIDSQPRAVLVFAALGGFLVACTVGAFVLGDLESDTARLQSELQKAPLSPKAVAPLALVAERHPANTVLAAHVAYMYETGKPRDLRSAFKWANRTLLLAPTYADGHMSSGRLLLRAGYRKQAFVAMRRAYELAEAERRLTVTREIFRLAKSPDEILLTVPRQDASLDVIDARATAAVALKLAEFGNKEWARALLDRIELETVPSSALAYVGSVALRLDALDAAIVALRRRRADHPEDAAATVALLDALAKKKDYAEAERVLSQVVDISGIDTTPFLRRRIELALRTSSVAVARESLEALVRLAPPTSSNQSEQARFRARIELASKRPYRALAAYNKAIEVSPENLGVRLERAQLLLRLGRKAEASYDVKLVLAAEPKHAGAIALAKRLAN